MGCRVVGRLFGTNIRFSGALSSNSAIWRASAASGRRIKYPNMKGYFIVYIFPQWRQGWLHDLLAMEQFGPVTQRGQGDTVFGADFSNSNV